MHHKIKMWPNPLFICYLWWKCGFSSCEWSWRRFFWARGSGRRDLKHLLIQSQRATGSYNWTWRPKSSAICLCVVCLVCDGGSSIPFIFLHPLPPPPLPGHVHRPGNASHGRPLSSRWCPSPLEGGGGNTRTGLPPGAALVLSTADVGGQRWDAAV